MTWFDRLSVRAAEGEPTFTRRTAVKTAAAGALATTPLASSAVAQVGVHLRESACQCQQEAERTAQRHGDAAWRQFIGPNGKRLLIPNNFMFISAALAGVFAGLAVAKLACGPCPSNPSGSLTGGGGGGGSCRPRGGTCPPPGSGCPSGTSPCDEGLCCFGSDLCCSCNGVAQCCVAEIGCTCCG
jgi:hypothetical protein